MSNDAFAELWQRFQEGENIPKTIEKHKKERARLLSRLEASISSRLAGRSEASPVRVLEVGCGTAIDSYLLASSFEGEFVDFVATDLSEEALEVARAIGEQFPARIKLQVADAFSLGLPDGHFDVVFSQGVLEHFADPLPALQEQARVTRSGGEVVVDLPQKYNLYTLYKRPRVRKGTWPYGWETEYSPRELTRMGEEIGLEPIDRFGYGTGLELSGRFPILRSLVRLYNKLTRAICEVVPISHWLLLNLVVVFQRK